jgi:hypothetical protein
MNYISHFYNSLFNKYYQNIYETFLTDKENQNILIVNQNYYNPLNDFSHHLKKYKLNLYIVSHSQETNEQINNEIKDEECSKYVHIDIYSIDKILNQYDNINFDKIILFHIRSLDYLENLLQLVSYYKVPIYIYISLSKKSTSIIKNKYRSFLKNINSIELGFVFSYSDLIEILENHSLYDLISIQTLEDSYYAIYGSHKNYKIILNPKS